MSHHSVFVSEGVWARLVGSRDTDVLLFEMSRQLFDEMGEKWTSPVQFRVAKTEGAIVTLELRTWNESSYVEGAA